MELEVLHPIELLEVPPYERRSSSDSVGEACNMVVSSSWPSERPINLIAKPRTTESKLHVRLAKSTECNQRGRDVPCSITVDFGASYQLLFVSLRTSVPNLEVFVGHRTPNGNLRFVYAETAFGTSEKEYPGRYRLDYTCPDTFQSIDGISFNFTDISNETCFFLDRLGLVFLDSLEHDIPVRASRSQSWKQPSSHHAKSHHRHSIHNPQHSMHIKNSQQYRQSILFPQEVIGSSRSLPDPPTSTHYRSVAEKSPKDGNIESMSAMMMVLDMQKKMLDDFEKRICATVDLKVHQITCRVEKSEGIIHDLEERLENIQQDKEIIFSGIIHRLNKLEVDFGELHKEQKETTAHLAAARQSVSVVRPSRWQY